jgi:hypothetical protein
MKGSQLGSPDQNLTKLTAQMEDDPNEGVQMGDDPNEGVQMADESDPNEISNPGESTDKNMHNSESKVVTESKLDQKENHNGGTESKGQESDQSLKADDGELGVEGVKTK